MSLNRLAANFWRPLLVLQGELMYIDYLYRSKTALQIWKQCLEISFSGSMLQGFQVASNSIPSSKEIHVVRHR